MTERVPVAVRCGVVRARPWDESLRTAPPQPPVLGPLGLSDTAEHVYRRVLAHGPIDGKDVARLANVPLLDARRAVAELSEAGLLTAPRPGWVRAAPPEIVLGAVVDERMHELDGVRLAIAEMQHVYRRQGGMNSALDVGEVVVGERECARRVDQALRVARREIRSVEATTYTRSPEVNDVEVERLKAGVSVRVLYSRATLAADALSVLQKHVEAGEEARTLPLVPQRMLAVDDQVVITPLDVDDAGVVVAALSLTAAPVVRAFVDLFDMTWQQAWQIGLGTGAAPDAPSVPGVPGPDTAGAPAGETAPAPGLVVLSEADRQLLALVAAGLKDEAIARQLGLSARTAQRRLSALGSQLGASNRLDLVRTALHRGLV